MSEIADELLDRTRKEREGKLTGEKAEEKSVIGLLSMPFGLLSIDDVLMGITIVKAENAGSELQMSQEEVLAQVCFLILLHFTLTRQNVDGESTISMVHEAMLRL